MRGSRPRPDPLEVSLIRLTGALIRLNRWLWPKTGGFQP
jgi:hypothetical protein